MWSAATGKTLCGTVFETMWQAEARGAVKKLFS
jgi:hypothetical protein